MSFPSNIKTQSLIASARHCCVCHRFNGVNVEVHHITPESEGGGNNFDNAVALCFDCHSAAGHYNPGHQKGTKYSRDEIRKGRDAWYEIVRKNHIEEKETSDDQLYCRYFICKNYSIASEIYKFNLQYFPIENTVLLKNAVFENIKYLTELNKFNYQVIQLYCGDFKNKKEYCSIYPDAKEISEQDNLYPLFNTIRIPDKSEIESKISNDDGVTKLLLESNLPIEDFAVACSFENKCGSYSYSELIRIRPIWLLFIGITNNREESININEIEGNIIGNDYTDITNFSNIKNGKQFNQRFPQMPLGPKMTALIPLGAILAPFAEPVEDSIFISGIELSITGPYQSISFVNSFQASQDDFKIWGRYFLPEKVISTKSLKKITQDIHKLDLTNLYTIDRIWECGSCPHLFFKKGNKLHFVKVLFSEKPNKILKEYIRVHNNVDSIIIAELENEITHIKAICNKDKVYMQDKYLTKDEYVEIVNINFENLTIEGSYQINHETSVYDNDFFKKNSNIREFLHLMNESFCKRPTNPCLHRARL
jgi:hypothetical protein